MPVRSATAQQALDALAARLREIRKDAELSARQIAQAAGWHESKCSRIEHARTIPSPADIRAWCAICGVPDQAADLTATLRSIDTMYVEWRRMIRSGMRRLQQAPLPLYERTRQFRIYEPGVIPGLFQTAQYARARMGRIIEFNGIPDDLDTAVAARLERQRILRRGDHRFAVVLEEWALRSRIGSTAMMTEQLAHLAQQSALPAVALGIIPASAARTMWSSPGFWIFDESRSKAAPAVYTYYHRPYNQSNPRHTAAHPDHQAHSASIREETIVAAFRLGTRPYAAISARDHDVRPRLDEARRGSA